MYKSVQKYNSINLQDRLNYVLYLLFSTIYTQILIIHFQFYQRKRNTYSSWKETSIISWELRNFKKRIKLRGLFTRNLRSLYNVVSMKNKSYHYQFISYSWINVRVQLEVRQGWQRSIQWLWPGLHQHRNYYEAGSLGTTKEITQKQGHNY